MFIHHNLLFEWFRSLKHLSTSVLIDAMNFLPRNKKGTKRTILSNHKSWLLYKRKCLMSLSISDRQELWLLYRRMQIKVLGRRRRWTFSRGVMEFFVFSRRRSRPFPLGVLEL
jgi:hypothetical protein